MAMTLTETSYWTRRLGILLLITLGIATIVAIVILNWERATSAPSFEKANYACTLTKEEFVKHQLEIPSLTLASGSEQIYELETETGKVDNLPRIVNVYCYNNPGETLNSKVEAEIIAEHLGFNVNEMTRKGTAEYSWTDSTTARLLDIKARNLVFTLSTDFSNPNAFPANASSLPSDQEAIQMATGILTGAGLMSNDYSTVQPYVTYINVSSTGVLTQAVSKADAELLRIDFFRETNVLSFVSADAGASTMIQKMENNGFELKESAIETIEGSGTFYEFSTQITTVQPQKSYISVYVGPSDPRKVNMNERHIYGIDYMNWYLEDQPCGTYEVIPAHTAIDIVQNGNGSLIYLNEKNGDDVAPYRPYVVKKFTIYNVTLGYYDTPTEETFLQPVYIISGDATFDTGILGQFYYYVPAINYDAVTDKVEDMIDPREFESDKNTGTSFF